MSLPRAVLALSLVPVAGAASASPENCSQLGGLARIACYTTRFEQGFPELKKEAARAFLERGCMPSLERKLGRDFPHALSPGVASQIQEYLRTISAAVYVQARADPKDSVRLYKEMILHVARRMGLEGDQKRLLENYAPSPVSDENDPLASYGRPPPVSCPEKSQNVFFLKEPLILRRGIQQGMLEDQHLPEPLKSEIQRGLEATREALLDGLRKGSESVGPGAFSLLENLAPPVSLRERSSYATLLRADSIRQGPSLPMPRSRGLLIRPPPGLDPLYELRRGIDAGAEDPEEQEARRAVARDRAGRLAAAIVLRLMPGDTSQCRQYVMSALDRIMSPGWRAKLSGSSAYQFAQALNSDPHLLLELGLARLDPRLYLGGDAPSSSPPLPIGTIIVTGVPADTTGDGICGMNRQHGHIAVVIKSEPLTACAYSCMKLLPTGDRLQGLDCLRHESRASPQRVHFYSPTRTLSPEEMDRIEASVQATFNRLSVNRGTESAVLALVRPNRFHAGVAQH